MVVTVSAATFLVMSLAATSKPVHTAANPEQIQGSNIFYGQNSEICI